MVTARDVGLLLVRASVGGTLAAHGAQKLFGWFGGAGLPETARMFEAIGFRPGRVSATAAGLGEAGAGALLAAGLGTAGAGAAAAGTMLVASSTHTPNGFFVNKGGFEFPAVLGAGALGIALAGPGALSLDELLGHRLNRRWMRTVAVAAFAPAAAAVISGRRRALAAASLADDATPVTAHAVAPNDVAAKGQD